MARMKNAKVPEVGSEVPEFNLPSAQGGSLRLGMRTATGPVIVAFFRGAWSEDDVSFFKKLAEKEDEINLAIGNVVGIGMVESAAAREFAKASGIKSYVLYDYAKTATPAWGLLEKDKENGEYARPATFLIGSDNKVVEAWMDDRPNPDDLLAKVSEITGLPKPPEEEDSEEKPKKAEAGSADGESTNTESADGESSEASAAEKPKREKPSPEEREKRRAERKAARESGGDAKPAAESGEAKAEAKSGGEAGNEEEAEGSDEQAEGASPEGASPEGSERGGSKSGDGSDASDGESGESRGEKKERKEGG